MGERGGRGDTQNNGEREEEGQRSETKARQRAKANPEAGVAEAEHRSGGSAHAEMSASSEVQRRSEYEWEESA